MEGKRMRKVRDGALGLALLVSAVLVVASAVGWVQISEAVVLHEGSTLLVVANGLRLLLYRA